MTELETDIPKFTANDVTEHMHLLGNLIKEQPATAHFFNALHAMQADEVQEFYILRDEAAGHPLIEKRDNALVMAKGYLANVGLDLNKTLSLDFVMIASS